MRMRPRVFLVLIVSVALLFIKGQARADVFQVQVLSLEECVEIALSGHPDLAAARSDLEASRARVGQARTQDNPSLAYSTSYTERGSSLQGSSGGLWSSSLTLSQLVTDWGKTHSSVKRSLSEQEISSLSLKQALLDVEYDVRRAYFLLLKAEKNLEVAKETMSINELQLEKAEAFFEAGRVSRYDVTAAQVSRSNANMALIQARTSRDNAMSDLRKAMGFTGAEFGVSDPEGLSEMTENKNLPLLEQALQAAYEKRPDLLSWKNRVESARLSVTLAKLDNAPKLSLSGSFGWGSSSFFGDEDWRGALTLSFSLYDGGLQKEKTREALSSMQAVEARCESFRQTVATEIESALSRARDSESEIEAAGEGLRLAGENLEIATGRYQVGVGSPIEVSDAARNYIDAKVAWHSAIYDRMIALAALEKAIGGSR